MSHQEHTSSEVTFHPEHTDAGEFQKRVVRTTLILSGITIFELALGFWIYFMHQGSDPSPTLILLIKGVICIMSLAKAFYIVSIFMHLGDEIRNLIMTIVVPLLLFVWFIIAFLYEGNSWKNLRNTDGHSREYVEPAHQAAPAHEAAPEAKKPGAAE
jgi:cytochrome c oxidase subunit IV